MATKNILLGAIHKEAIFEWANPDLFLFIFVLFKHKLTEKTVGVSRIQTQIVKIEGKHAVHLTTTTAQVDISSIATYVFSICFVSKMLPTASPFTRPNSIRKYCSIVHDDSAATFEVWFSQNIHTAVVLWLGW